MSDYSLLREDGIKFSKKFTGTISTEDGDILVEYSMILRVPNNFFENSEASFSMTGVITGLASYNPDDGPS